MPGRDFKKELRALYSAKAGRIAEFEAPPLTYLALDGVGHPQTAFGAAIGAVYAIAYPLKFAIKARDPTLDYVVMPPEALYPGPPETYARPSEDWTWTILVLQPVEPTARELADAVARATAKGVPGAERVALRRLHEGSCVQTLHLGPYEAVHSTITALHGHMDARGLRHHGPHHEIYLSDPRRAEPAKIKTILRQPVVATRATVPAR